MKDLEKKARAYALKNALAHDGKAQVGPVISSLFNEGLNRNEAGKYAKEVSKIVNDVNKLNLEQQEKEFSELKDITSEREAREGLQELPNVKKTGVIMRFAPSPSGPMHIGHAATSCISFLYVKKYGGKFYVRIEDTNPENIYPPAYKMLEEESKKKYQEKRAEEMTELDYRTKKREYDEQLKNRIRKQNAKGEDDSESE